jgi:predicted amidohydrolase YtcJ
LTVPELDLLVVNARISTFDVRRPHAAVLGVAGGRIVALWDDDPGVAAKSRLDVQGAAVLPGFHDAHCHTVTYGMALTALDLADITTADELLHRVAEAASAPLSEWVIGNNLRYYAFQGGLPTRHQLDRVANGKLVVLKFSSRHGLLANTGALLRAGVLDSGFVVPEGGRVDVDQHGDAIGTLHEGAQDALVRLTQDRSRADIVAAIDGATRAYAAEGIVGFTDAGVGLGLVGHGRHELHAYRDARQSGKLHARAQLMPTADTALTPWLEDGPGFLEDFAKAGDDWLSLGHTKMFFDGAITSETAALTTPYPGGTNRGLLTAAPQELLSAARKITDRGWPLAIHAIGDHAVDVALDVIEECQRLAAFPALAPRIEHAGMVRHDQLERIAALGVVVVPQTAFFKDVGDAMLEHLAPERHAELYRVASFIEAGIPVAGSSDRPCVDGDALRCIDSFSSRATGSGDTINSREQIGRLEALHAYTVSSTAAAGFADDRGTLTSGKLADMVVLDGDPLDGAVPLEGGRVLATLVGGSPTYLSSALTLESEFDAGSRPGR